MKSSFVLGCEQPENIVSPKKSGLKKVNPITGEVEGEPEPEPIKILSEKFEKSCKVPPGGHTTKLWWKFTVWYVLQ